MLSCLLSVYIRDLLALNCLLATIHRFREPFTGVSFERVGNQLQIKSPEVYISD